MMKRLLGAAFVCVIGGLAHGAEIEAIFTEGQGLLPVVTDDLPTLPTAVILLSGDTATIRLDLSNDGNSDARLFLLPVFITNIGAEPLESTRFSLAGEGVEFLLAPSVVPFATTELDALSQEITAYDGPLLPGGIAFATFFLNAFDSDGDHDSTFSTDLVIRVPEPTSSAVLGVALVAGFTRRTRTS